MPRSPAPVTGSRPGVPQCGTVRTAAPTAHAYRWHVARAKGLLLDVGVVLFKSAWELLPEFEAWLGLAPGTLPWRGALDPEGDPLWQRHLAGELSEGEYWMAFAAECERAGASPAGYDHVMQAIFQAGYTDVVRPEAARLVADAKAAGLAYGILTNELEALHGRRFVERFPAFRQADVLIDATRTGVRKPDPRSYRAAIDALGLAPADIVFVDDNPRYVAGGEAVGLQAILLDVRDPAAAFAEARARLGLAG